MSTINVTDKVIGKIKPLHGVGQPPFHYLDFKYMHYLKDANIPFSRLHDVGGWFGGNMFVDIPNLFRDFDANPSNPESYDFAFTDMLLEKIIENGTEPFFRLGVTIENFAKIRAYRIYPPKDNLKWAKICEGIIRHYTEGWANGFHYNIRYWEIFNEPDNHPNVMSNPCWRGTKEQFYDLYNTASIYLKEKFPHLKIGGYASCGFYAIFNNTISASAHASERTEYFIEFLDGFLDSIKKSGAPLDFFSWHCYDTLKNMKAYAEYAEKRIREAGYPDAELFCNEWNCGDDSRVRTPWQAANIAGAFLAMCDMPLDGAMFYDGRIEMSAYNGMFDPATVKPIAGFYAFQGFGELYRLGNRVEVEGDMPDGVFAVAAENGSEKYLMVANTNDSDAELKIDNKIKEALIVDGGNGFVPYDGKDVIPAYGIMLYKLDI